MLTINKKNTRPRAKTTSKGLTIDPRFAQDFFRSNRPSVPSVILEEGSTAEQIAPADREKNNGFQRRADLKPGALRVDTRLARETCKAENSGFSAHSRLAWKVGHSESPRLTEAMQNKNWRSHRQPFENTSPDANGELWSAPPEQSKFLVEDKGKPRRGDEYETIDYARGLQRTAYRCRRPDEVKPELVPFTKPESISADLCLSAPATKTEFSTAEMETQERSVKYDPRICQPSIKSIVRLDEMTPIKRAGYENILGWDEQHAESRAGRRLCDSSSLTVVSLADSPEGWETVDFPYAEIRAVKGNKKFAMGLSDVEEKIRNQLSTLVEPQSASLPPEYLRKEYEEIREERRKAMALAQSTVESRGRRGRVVSDQGPKTETPSDTHFNNLLGKLNKLCAPRLRAFTVNDKDNSGGCTFVIKPPEKSTRVEPTSPSGDSGIGGLSPKGRQRSSTLNPEASEFCFTTQEKQSPATVETKPAVPTPPIVTDLAQPSHQVSGSMDPIRILETRVAELEAQIARQGSNHSQAAHQKRGKGYKATQGPHRASGPVVPGGGVHYPGMNRNIEGPTGYQTTYPTLPNFPMPNLAMGAGGIPSNPMAVTGCGALPQIGLGFPTNAMPNNILNQINLPQVAMPFSNNGAATTPTPPATGTSLWVKTVFGPKPVSKPDRPFRPGDGVQAVRQQEYEEYLEHLRATDPTYAMSCKQRQARRADRLRSGAPKLSC
ncbi:hypothetical protein NPX13_g5567 [Xylaria arbuscula]|uniref:Uncharacterized protein n=1 Tax=Xylaria arbuscula TaxID=114810 RepID=A0A9W8TL64_9PEZI|nr:hypothetical protein NPX13_g5567 [Xylaria arbuscula]